MNKKNQNQNNCLSPDDSQKSYEVQKIVNQRVINGKKQYKVIWFGYSFQEATWEPEQNLKCPDKISQFLKRYQDVIRRKNLMNKAGTQAQNNPSNPNASKGNQPQLQKISLQKPQTVQLQQQKTIPNQASTLNKQKLQASFQKSGMVSQKRPQDIQSLKSKIMTPHPVQGAKTVKNDQPKSHSPQTAITPNRQGLNISETQPLQAISEKISIPSQICSVVVQKPTTPATTTPSKIIKIQNNSQPSGKLQHTQKTISSSHINKQKIQQEFQCNQDNQSKYTPRSTNVRRQSSANLTMDRSERDQFLVSGNSQQRKISSVDASDEENVQCKNKPRPQLIFISINERLDISKVLAVTHLDLTTNSPPNSQKQHTLEQATQRPVFFLVKNRFSHNQKLIYRQRLLDQQPLKLIQFYEQLLMDSQ